jgi:hypothetical protein
MIFFVLGWIKSFDTGHALAKPARTIDLDFLRERLGAVYTGLPGRPSLPIRLMAGLAILSDEGLCGRCLESPRGAARAPSFDNCLGIQHLRPRGMLGSNIWSYRHGAFLIQM